MPIYVTAGTGEDGGVHVLIWAVRTVALEGFGSKQTKQMMLCGRVCTLSIIEVVLIYSHRGEAQGIEALNTFRSVAIKLYTTREYRRAKHRSWKSGPSTRANAKKKKSTSSVMGEIA